MINPKARALISRLTTVSEEGKKNLLGILELALEVFPDGKIPDYRHRFGNTTSSLDEAQALRSTHAGYTRLDLLFAVCLIVLYLIAGSAAPTVLTEAGTAAAGSNYHGF